MNQKISKTQNDTISNEQQKRQLLAERLAALPEEKRVELSGRLAEQGIDIWQLPIVPMAKNFSPLSFAQQRLWFLEQLNPGNTLFNLFYGLQFHGELNHQWLNGCLNKILQRHDVLRSRIHVVDDNATQFIAPYETFALELTDLTEHLSVDEIADTNKVDEALTALAKEQAEKPFDLTKDLLFRFLLVKISESHHVGFFTIHHCVFDVRSLDNLCRELTQLYQWCTENPEHKGLPSDEDLPVLTIQYQDYATWQQQWANSLDYQRQFDYWEKQLDGVPENLTLSIQKTNFDRKQRHVGRTCQFNLPIQLANDIYRLAKRKNATVYIVMLAVFKLLLSRYSGEKDICIGTSIANRSRLEIESMMGFLVNLLVLRSHVDEDLNFTDYLDQVNRTSTDAFDHQDIPFERLIKAERNQSHSPLFQVLFVMNSGGGDMSLQLPGLKMSGYGKASNRARYDLTLRVFEGIDRDAPIGMDRHLNCAIEFDCALFDQNDIEAMLEHYCTLLRSICDDDTQTLKQLNLLDKTSVEQQVHLSRSSELPTNQYTRIHHYIEAQASERPNATAVQCEQITLSFAQLNAQANQLAHYLREHGFARESKVALYMERSEHLIIGLLAILKAGAAYIPLDTRWPRKRITQVLNDCGATMVLSESTWQQDLAELANIKTLCLDTANDWANQSSDNLGEIGEPQDAAYVIYTSGTTGEPKGVVIEHKQIIHYIEGVVNSWELFGKSFAHISTIAADLGNTSLFGALCFGGCLQLITSERAFDPDAVANQLRDYPVDVLKIVPSHLKGLLAAENATDILPRSTLILGGESCNMELLNTLKKWRPDLRVINHYGPSETTVGVLTHEITPLDLESQIIPLGRPLPGVHAYVVDSAGQLCPQGIAGELHIGGVTVGRGYLKREQLTKERFTHDVFSEQVGERVYRTGDKVKMLPTGELVFLGRVDNQVKVRGYRVELADIQACLERQTCVDSACVQLQEGFRSSQLVAYVVPNDSQLDSAKPDEVKIWLEALNNKVISELPDYMVPQQTHIVESIPLTVNGKVDLKALNHLGQQLEPTQERRLPTNKQEQVLMSAWQKILNQEAFGIDDNFFSLGGDSILSLQLVALVRRSGYQLTPKLLFENQTIAQLAKLLIPIDKNVATDVLVTGEVTLAPIQQWFFESKHPHPAHWNQSMLFGVKKPLNSEALRAAVALLVNHHDQLRSEFIVSDAGITQRVLDVNDKLGESYYHSVLNIDEARMPEAINQWLAGLSLTAHEETGQLFKVVHFRYENQTQEQLLIIAHHLLIDGVSWRVLMEDLQTAYEHFMQPAIIRSKKSPLPPKTQSYQRWSQTQKQMVQETVTPWQQKAEAYWNATTEKLKTCQVLQQPSDDYRLKDLRDHSSVLDKETTQALLQAAPKAYQTQINDLLLTALGMALAKQREDDGLYVELEGHGRESLDDVDYRDEADLSRTIGWFTSRFPVLLPHHLEQTGHLEKRLDEKLSQKIKSCKEALRALPSQGASYGALRYHGKLAALPSPAITFNYLGQTQQQAQSEIFTASPYNSAMIQRHPESRATHLLTINAVVINEQLRINWRHIAEQNYLDVERLAKDFNDALQNIVVHCGKNFIGYTPSDFPLVSLNQEQLDDIVADVGVEKLQDIYPITPMQQGLMLHTLLKPGTGIYFMQYRYQIKGQFDHEHFTKAWQQVVARHEVLRTAFRRYHDHSLQVVYKEGRSPVEILDWRDLSEAEQDSQLQVWMQERVKESFDLSIPTQLAITLIRTGDECYQLVRSFHHILMDAWCFSLLMNDFLRFYRAAQEDELLSLPSPRPYRDYIRWLEGQDRERAENFWRDTLTGFEAPTKFSIESEQSTKGVKDHVSRLTVDETQWLQALAQQNETTLNTLVQAAWGLVLSRYSNDNDIIFGVTVAGRPTEMDGADTIVGLFINSLPLRINTKNSETLIDYLKQILTMNHRIREFEFAPLADIQHWSDVAPGVALFDSLFVYENAPVDRAEAKKTGSRFELVDSSNRTHTNYPLTVVVYPKSSLGLQITYDCSQFADADVSRMLSHFKRLLINIGKALEVKPATKISDINMISEAEQRQILVDWNQSYTDYPRQKCWPELFLEQVQQSPDAIATSCGDRRLTFVELKRLAMSLASELKQNEVGANDVVAVLDKRDLNLHVMIVGILLSGAAYLPLDPAHPEQRLATVLHSSQAKLLLCGSAYENLAKKAIDLSDNQNLATNIQGCRVFDYQKTPVTDCMEWDLTYATSDLAYVIYTSGSTGIPKGAMIEHLGMLNNVYAKIPHLTLTDKDVIAQTASQCFDISVWQFLTGLICGARIQIYPDDISHNALALLDAMEADKVTILESVPGLIHSFIEFARPLTGLRWLMPTGEALTPTLAQSWLQSYPHIPMVNAYGPAECADDVAFWPIRTLEETQLSSIPIGTPTDNNRLYVISPEQQLQPVGVPGELYVAGAGVGRGYLNDEQRTKEVFIENFLLSHPQQPEDDNLDQPQRLYRTGDLARWRSDGALEYLGRVDHQVKIRGYRIELGEIEACIEACSDVTQVAVVIKSDPRGDNSIVAFYSSPSRENSESQIRAHIQRTLPAYMMPSLFIALEKMPLNNSGKIDRRALPDPDFGATIKNISEPRNDIEKELVGLWCDILKLERVDIFTSFFALGGHSLLAIRLHAKICQHFAVELSLRSLFERNSVADVAEQLELQMTAGLLADDSESEEEFEEFEL